MKKIQKNKGITLIALIITIIVLLILAGVSISLVVGDNGVLVQSKNASDVTKAKSAEEELKLGISTLAADYFSGSKVGTFRSFIFSEDSKAKLNQELHGGAIFDDTNYTITYKETIYQVEENGDFNIAEGIILIDKLTLIKGVDTTYQLEAQQKSINTTLTYRSSNQNVATIDENTGLVTLPQNGIAGTSIITVEGNYNGKNYSRECELIVAEVSILIDDLEVAIGGNETLTATITPSSIIERNEFTINWESETTSVAVVNPVTGISTTAEVPSTANEGDTSKITAVVKIGNTTLAEDTCLVTAIKAIGYFKTIVDSTTGKGTAYYFANQNDTEGTPITLENMGDYLGMQVDYTPFSYYGDLIVSEDCRLFYVDVGNDEYPNGKYGDGSGTIYLKIGTNTTNGVGGLSYNTIKNMEQSGENVMNKFNPLWYNSFSSSKNINVTLCKALLDKKIWECYTDTADMDTSIISKYATGAPSLEMWVDSYNIFLEKYPLEGYHPICYTTTRDLENGPDPVNNGNGYYVGYNGLYTKGNNYVYSSFPSSYTYPNGSIARERYNVYLLQNWSYFLASPYYVNEHICWVYDGSSKLISSTSSGSAKISPLICVKPGAKVNTK